MKVADVLSVALGAEPEELGPVPQSLDHGEHVVAVALAGHPQLAADHLLHREMSGRLVETAGAIVRRLNLEFLRSRASPNDPAEVQRRKLLARLRAYEVLVEVAVNLSGVEARAAGFSDGEADEAFRHITRTLEGWEALEGEEQPESRGLVAGAVVDRLIREMKKVMGGGGMVAKMGEEIEGRLVKGRAASSFAAAAREVIQGNVYYRMATRGLCKFGNDYALGLRWLRHLGYVQVSTNPVLAARAYDDDPGLWDRFGRVAREHPEWLHDPEAHGDEIAMEATQVALWPNLAVFRPIALLSRMHDGMVSYQLNPNVADSLEGSLADALRIYASAEEFLRRYDAHLTWGYSAAGERGRPNIVFKVAGSSPAAVEVTRALNRAGIGTNNTVTYTVAQETTLILAAMEGMAEALRKGIRITQAYETNMGGRLESHLRDLEAERLLTEVLRKTENGEGTLRRLAEALGALGEAEREAPLEERVRAVCGFRYLKSLTHPAFVEAVAESKVAGRTREETLRFLSRLEGDIGLSGTLVAQRVYRIFFSPENRPRWLAYLRQKHGLSEAEAEEVMNKIDVLPASKRKPEDTLLTLARRNMTNTEFPDHQLKVLNASRQMGFNLAEYEDAVMRDADPGVVQRLLKLGDFRRAYDSTPELVKRLKEVGVSGDFGDGGLGTAEWPAFGSVVKTMREFTDAYNSFKKRAIEFVHRLAEGSS